MDKNKMVATFGDFSISEIKIIVFWFDLHWILFLSAKLKINEDWFR